MQNRKLKLSEEMLVRAIREKHPSGAKALYDMYSGSLYGIIVRIIRDLQYSEDVLQEVFLKIWTSFERYDTSKARLYTWMMNIARNMAIDRIRSKSFRKMTQTEGLAGCEEIEAPLDALERVMDRKIVYSGLRMLREPERKVMELIYAQGFTHQEAAVILQIPLGTVKTRIVKAVKRLRTYYLDQEIRQAS